MNEGFSFLFLHKTYCRYSLEVLPKQGAPTEYHNMFPKKIKKNIYLAVSLFCMVNVLKFEGAV